LHLVGYFYNKFNIKFFFGGGGGNVVEVEGLSIMYKRAQETVYLELIKIA
jgi:hypothetical protein